MACDRLPAIFNAHPVRSELLTPLDYQRLVDRNPRVIERAEFIPPSPGGRGFGMFNVRYRSPMYKHKAHGWISGLR